RASASSDSLTYAGLARRADRLAAALRAAGVGPEGVVGVYLARSLDVLVALLGIWRAGGAYLPLNPAYPAARLQFMLADAGAQVVVTHAALRDGLPASDARVVCVDRLDGLAAAGVETAVTPEQLAYVIYTSGSTGQPKGVAVTHAAIAAHCQDVCRVYGLTAADRVLQFSAHSFDASLEQMLPTLLTGGAVVMRGAALWSPAELDARLAALGVTVANFPTAYWGELAEAWAGAADLRCAQTVRLVIAGGESMAVRQLRAWRRTPLAGVRLLNAYGPTETTITATVCDTAELDPAALPQPGVPIGRPLGNRLALIVDANDQPTPVGVAGELVLGGAGVARGYLGRAELTAERFVDGGFGISDFGGAFPKSEIPNPKFYRTGDRACWRPDGMIQLLGRADDQVKIRGYRIELGEIEAALLAQTAVAAAAVLVRERAAGERELVGFVAPQAGAAPDAAALRAHLRQTLPAYMVPARLVLLDALPLTPNGKVDRQALLAAAAAAAADESVGQADGAAAETGLEAALAAIFAGVLGQARVGRDENFFDAGGHSLQAVQLVARVGQQLGRRVAVRDVFAAPTVAELAALLAAADEKPGRADGAADGAVAPLAAATGEVTEVRAPLAPRLRRGELPPLDGAALGYLGDPDSTFEQALFAACEGRPMLSGVTETAWGRLGLVLLPRFLPDLYADPAGTLDDIAAALAFAGELGARTVALTGLIPSATDYGRAIRAAVAGRPGLPRISTGHAVTTAAVVLTVERLLAESGRDLAAERVGFLGLGSIGAASLRLMLSVLPHPRALLLCDLYSKRAELEALRAELVGALGYRGEVVLIESRTAVPAPFYEATLMVGATSVADVLAVPALRPGTLLVDDSGPHCFDVAQAIRRFQDHGDILFTEGGVLQLPQPARRLRYVPAAAAAAADRPWQKMFLVDDRREIMGCAFSSVLSARYPDLQPTVGEIELAAVLPHYTQLVGLGFRGGSLHCGGFRPDAAAVRRFRRRFAARDNDNR
ncbi:MAG: amino acid adenylation domain-containing protein, partial [Anaerolineales bacterium]|nr:amino acid adenylation domain-containing protein [Anaerolineales bacterium]